MFSLNNLARKGLTYCGLLMPNPIINVCQGNGLSPFCLGEFLQDMPVKFELNCIIFHFKNIKLMWDILITKPMAFGFVLSR